MRLLLLFGIATFCLSLPLRADLATLGNDTPPVPPVDRKPVGIEKLLNGYMSCSVSEVKQDSITVCWQGGMYREMDSKGKIVHEEFIPPRLLALPVCQELAEGGIGGEEDADSWSSYRLSDVNAGDKVSIFTRVLNGRYTCTNIRINRRPGGRVPPAPLDHLPDGSWRWHERANAEQDFEEKGIPLPKKYLPETEEEMLARNEAIVEDLAEQRKLVPPETQELIDKVMMELKESIEAQKRHLANSPPVPREVPQKP